MRASRFIVRTWLSCAVMSSAQRCTGSSSGCGGSGGNARTIAAAASVGFGGFSPSPAPRCTS